CRLPCGFLPNDPDERYAALGVLDLALAHLPDAGDGAGREAVRPVVRIVVVVDAVVAAAAGTLVGLGELPSDGGFLGPPRPRFEFVEGDPEGGYVVEGRPVPGVSPVPGFVKSRSGTRTLRLWAARNSWRRSPAEASSHSSVGSMSAGSTRQAATSAGMKSSVHCRPSSTSLGSVGRY